MAKYRKSRTSFSVENKEMKNKKETSQLTIKIDCRLNKALLQLSSDENISRNGLIENILIRSGLIEEVDENYY